MARVVTQLIIKVVVYFLYFNDRCVCCRMTRSERRSLRPEGSTNRNVKRKRTSCCSWRTTRTSNSVRSVSLITSTLTTRTWWPIVIGHNTNFCSTTLILNCSKGKKQVTENVFLYKMTRVCKKTSILWYLAQRKARKAVWLISGSFTFYFERLKAIMIGIVSQAVTLFGQPS